MARRVRANLLLCFCACNIRAIDIADITATEYVAVAICKTFIRTYFTTVDMHLGLTKHIAVGIERTFLTVSINIVALATTEHIALYMAIIHLNVRLTSFVDAF